MATRRHRLAATGLVLVLVLVLLGACASTRLEPKAEVRGGIVTLTAGNTGQSIEMTLDQELVVKLASEPSRGYRWVRDSPVAGLLAPVGNPAFQREALDTNVFGAAGFDIFRFKPGGPGQQTLRFEYRRQWDRDSAPSQMVSYSVTVR